MRPRACAIPCLVFGALILGGCSEGEIIPPSKGGAEARQQIEYPLGPPPAPKNAKSKKSATPKEAPPAGPAMAH